MLRDRYDQELSTNSSTARDAYVEGCDCLYSLYPGADEAFNRAAAADPEFALAHLGTARAQVMANDTAAATASLAKAHRLTAKLLPRETSYVELLGLIYAGKSVDALPLLRSHLKEWPRDAAVLSLTSNPAGLIWGSGRAKREQELVDLMSGISQHYGDDWWFNADYAMALSDNGQQEMARPRIEQSMAKNPRNAWGAHALGHLYYECNEHDAAINFMRGYLHEYPRQGLFHGHLHWHLALSELHAGNYEEGLRLYNAAFGADSYFGVPRQKLADASSFLWRAELAGHPRDAERWRSLHDFGVKMFPKPSTHMADWHFALTNAAVGDGAALEARIKDISDLARAGRYPSGQMVPVISRAFAAFQKQDYCAVIEMLEPKIAELARIGGSRAQTDLIELTLMRAYIQADRLEDLRRLLARRRAGPSASPVAGIERIN